MQPEPNSTPVVLLADVHEFHGNTPIIGIEGKYERMTVVCYYRRKMVLCGTAHDEFEQYKSRKPVQPIWNGAHEPIN